jgi:hypothetical protein
MSGVGIPPSKAIGEAITGTAAEAAHSLFPAVIGAPGAEPPPAEPDIEMVEGFEDLPFDPGKPLDIPEHLKKSTELTGKPGGHPRVSYLPPAEEPIYTPGEEGSGSGGFSGSISGTVGPPIPGEYVAAQQAHMANLAAIDKLGHQARFDALGLVVDAASELDELWRADFEGTDKHVKSLLDEAETEANGIRDLIDASRADQINPGEFFANIGGAGRFGAAMALGAGAMATAFGGGPNAAMQIISQAIDRNVRAQMSNQTHNRALIAHQANFVHTIRGLAKDQMQYANFLRIGYTAMAKNRIATISAGYSQTQAKLAFLSVDDKLGAKLVEAEIRALTAARQKVTFKFKSMAQYNQQLKLLGGASPAGAGGRGTGPALASGRSRGGTGKQLTKGGQPQGVEQPTSTGGAEQPTSTEVPFSTKNIEKLKTEFKRFSETHSDKEVFQKQQQIVKKLRASGDIATGDTLAILGRTSLLSHRKTATVGVSVAGVPKGAIPGPVFNALKGEAPAKAISEVSAAATMYEYTQDVHDLLRTVNFASRATMLKSLRTYEDDWMALPARDPNKKASLNEITIKILAIQEFNRKAQGTRNALDKAHEIVRAHQTSGSDISFPELMTDLIMRDPELRQKGFSSVMQINKNKMIDAQEKWQLRLVPNE